VVLANGSISSITSAYNYSYLHHFHLIFPAMYPVPTLAITASMIIVSFIFVILSFPISIFLILSGIALLNKYLKYNN
jgi:hypothetical protein